MGEQKDCTPAALRIIKEASKYSVSKIIIERGTYHFYPDKAFQKYCYITNHDNGLRSTPFPLINVSNIEIEADSAKFIFHGVMIPFIIENSDNVRLSGFSIDWKIPLHSEVEVISVDEINRTFDIKIDPDTPYYIRNGELLFLKEGFEHNLDRSICWDKHTMAPVYKTREITPLTLRSNAVIGFADSYDPLYEPDQLSGEYRYRGTENSLVAEQIAEGIVRIHGHRKDLPKKGCVIVAKGLNAYNRFAPAITVSESKNIELQDVTVHHAGGMGFVAERTEDVKLNNFNVALKPGSGRMLTTTADATHFNNCRGLVEITNCTFENMLDDGTNIHGVYMEVADIIDEYTVGAKIGHFQQAGFDFAEQGDRIGFVSEKSLFPFHENIISKVEMLNDRYYLLSFEEKIDPGVKSGDLLDNLDWYPEVIAKNNIVRNNRARGFLFSTPKKIVCENNYFSSMNEAIKAGAGFGGSWYESGFIKELYIRNNHFAEGCFGGSAGSLINIYSAGTEDETVFEKIVIESNEFKTFDPGIINVGKIDSLIIQDNKIYKSVKYPPIKESNPVIEISLVKHPVFSENTFYAYKPSMIFIDEFSKADLEEAQNTWITDAITKNE